MILICLSEKINKENECLFQQKLGTFLSIRNEFAQRKNMDETNKMFILFKVRFSFRLFRLKSKINMDIKVQLYYKIF